LRLRSLGSGPDHTTGIGSSFRFQAFGARHPRRSKIPGDIDDHNALIAAHQQKQFQHLGTLVVQRSLPPAPNDEFGNKDGDLAVGGLAFDFEDVIN
jgi:hypothetical protein